MKFLILFVILFLTACIRTEEQPQNLVPSDKPENISNETVQNVLPEEQCRPLFHAMVECSSKFH